MTEDYVCLYNGCWNKATTEITHHGEDLQICQGCVEKAVDDSGYCGVSCLLGYGCDHSC